ncbi:Protein Wnt-16 [Bulinus truncatus]|nr:Protein Wnt-16 [Bulinus truncatus]
MIKYRGTRETAFVYAVLSAGVVHSVTQACSVGNLTDCSCDMTRYGEADVDGWKWGGCSDNVDYGLWFSRNFVDAPDAASQQNGRNVRNLMNLHNNEVGRKEDKFVLHLSPINVSPMASVFPGDAVTTWGPPFSSGPRPAPGQLTFTCLRK